MNNKKADPNKYRLYAKANEPMESIEESFATRKWIDTLMNRLHPGDAVHVDGKRMVVVKLFPHVVLCEYEIKGNILHRAPMYADIK